MSQMTGHIAKDRPSEEKLWGVIGQFDSQGAILRAARETRKAGFARFDAHTPYPIHGMDRAMGLGRSVLGWIVAGGAFAGAMTGIAMQYYVNWAYPLVHQGKPIFAWQPMVIVTFELAVLFAAFSAVIGMLALNGLPQWYHPTLKSEKFAKVSDDGFFISIECEDETELTRAEALLQNIGAISTERLMQ